MPPRKPLPTSFSLSYVCPRCAHHLRSSSRRTFSSTSSNLTKYTVLTNKRLLRLAGPDATNFLHDLIPAKILGVGTTPIYTAFLTAHGRILSDAFVYPPSWTHGNADTEGKGEPTQRGEFEWWIEADEFGADILAKHFRKHKLRAKFQLERVKPEQAQVVYEWPSQDGRRGSEDAIGFRAGGKDPRPGMGYRSIIETERVPEAFAKQGDEKVGLKKYTVHRMLNGLAEGHKEIISGSALPQESNIDIMGGIDFHKGCYLGQELTIRTHHTGVVRKRILPVQIYDENTKIATDQVQPVYDAEGTLELPPPESNMSKASSKRKGRSTGKWLGGVGNIGLALCRLEMMTDIQLTADGTNYDPNEEYKVQWGSEEESLREVKVRPFVPTWIRGGIEQNLRRKDKKPSRRRDEEDEEEEELD